jgi:hypothetical protein
MLLDEVPEGTASWGDRAETSILFIVESEYGISSQ